MDYDKKLLQDTKKLMLVRYPCFGAEIAAAKLEYRTDLKYHTAATDGKNIYFDPNYLASLNDDEKVFIIAHELMHIKFEHMLRLEEKDGKMRDQKVWNIATDAIINANLERDGFKIKEGYVNMPEALNYNAEEFYNKLIKERQKQTEKDQNGQSGQGQEGKGEQAENDGQEGMKSPQKGKNGDMQGGQDKDREDEGEKTSEKGQNENAQGEQDQQDGQGSDQDQDFADDHSLWEESFKQSKQGGRGQKDKTNKDNESQEGQEDKNSSTSKENSYDKDINQNGEVPDFEEVKFDEKSQFIENRKLRREIARQKFDKMKNTEMQKSQNGDIDLGEVGNAKAILDWKQLLRREVEKTETVWSQRRSIAENNYAYRLEENDIEDEAETEVMIDVSGSVSIEMVKAFLRQLKPLLKESKLKVGCFNEKFWGMVEIKSDRDIDNFKIPVDARGYSARTEDWDLAVRSFSKKREVNKIVFTDGIPGPGNMPKADLKGINVLWLVYSNRQFNPCCGKVIDIYPKDLQNMVNTAIYEEDEMSL